ncbi:hypothetical protein OBBRIDRAFT_319433 [Obba rivulosa]|uniref:Uncharacterized protein n=1 Tax=Obba rivulosa TaxID=1052685 RepID=A0A8E2J4Z2_9APHY|nr:hypothetical protein OBBRIDRAFT_319433 [Obba rivulosa]
MMPMLTTLTYHQPPTAACERLHNTLSLKLTFSSIYTTPCHNRNMSYSTSIAIDIHTSLNPPVSQASFVPLLPLTARSFLLRNTLLRPEALCVRLTDKRQAVLGHRVAKDTSAPNRWYAMLYQLSISAAIRHTIMNNLSEIMANFAAPRPPGGLANDISRSFTIARLTHAACTGEESITPQYGTWSIPRVHHMLVTLLTLRIIWTSLCIGHQKTGQFYDVTSKTF